MIPDRVSEVPPPLAMTTTDGRLIMAGEEIATEQVLARPEDLNLWWDGCDDQERLFAVFLMDNEGMPEGIEYLNYFAYNVRGCDVASADFGFDFLPPFAFDMTDIDGEAGTAALDVESDRTAAFIFLVYEQDGYLCPEDVGLEQTGCSPDILGPDGGRASVQKNGFLFFSPQRSKNDIEKMLFNISCPTRPARGACRTSMA